MFNSLWYHQISNILKKDQTGHDVLLISCELPYDRLCKGCVLKWKSKRTTNTRLNGFSDWLLFLYQITNESVRALAKNFGVKEISLEVTEHKFDAKKKKNTHHNVTDTLVIPGICPVKWGLCPASLHEPHTKARLMVVRAWVRNRQAWLEHHLLRQWPMMRVLRTQMPVSTSENT